VEARIPPMAAVFLQPAFRAEEADLGCSRSMNRFLVNNDAWSHQQQESTEAGGHCGGASWAASPPRSRA